MGRRSQHKPEELRELILDAAQRIVEGGGISQLSAREVARMIGYAPGTLYNMYENLDDILLRVQARMLESLDDRLVAAMSGTKGSDAIRGFATCYLDFAHERPKLWSLLQEHHLALGKPAPQWYLDRLFSPPRRLEGPIAYLIKGEDEAAVQRSARSLWASIHGIALQSTSRKIDSMAAESGKELIENLVETYIAGLKSLRAKAGDQRAA